MKNIKNRVMHECALFDPKHLSQFVKYQPTACNVNLYNKISHKIGEHSNEDEMFEDENEEMYGGCKKKRIENCLKCLKLTSDFHPRIRP